MTDGPRVEAIDRALALLTALAEAGADGITLTELSAATGVNKSTAYRALSTMRAHGFVAQSESTGDYRLGAAAMTLGERFLTPQSLVQSLHPALVTLSRQSDELVHLGVLVGDEVLYLDKVEPERAIRVFSEVGRRTSAARSAMGRALLAARNVPHDQLAAYLHHCALTVDELAATLAAARGRGFATEIEENERGVACLGVAVMRGANAVAALSLTMPAERLTEQRQRELAELIGGLLPPLLPDGLSIWSPVALAG
ncbi:MAG: IclR family transcriptional regulator [Micropruina sp.]|uniref:IclR family transcriptional regulator n=1 Tax=Micropruina sp. TaxID=2737536 RepID=UPI0039E5F65E